MAVRQSLLSADDFDRILNDYFGRNVSHTPRTQSVSNITGEESFTEGSATDVFSYFLKRDQPWTFDKASNIEGGDAVLLAKYTDAVEKDDLIAADGETYVVHDVINVPGVFNEDGSVELIYSYCNLFLKS